MNVLKRAFLYDMRKRGKNLTLFQLFTLITIFVTISFSVLSATKAAATNLRETVGASFTLRGNPMEFSAGETDFSMQFATISQQDIDLIAGSTEIKACKAQQSATATASGFIFPSGMPSGTISANTSSVWNRNFTEGGADVRTVAALLGHSQASTTMNIYAHSFEETQARAGAAVGELLGRRKAAVK